MRRAIAGVALSLGCARADRYLCQGEKAGADHPRAAAYQAALDAAVDAGLPGVVAAVDDPDGRWIGASGFADLLSGAPMAVCSPLRLGSLSTTWTAAAALQAAEEGLLDLDAPISTLLDADTAARLPGADAATPRHLLNQTSGLPDYLNRDCVLAWLNATTRPFDAEDLLRCVEDEPVAYEAGMDFEPAGVNYAVLGMVLEAAEGRSIETILQTRIFDVAGLDRTTFGGEPDALAEGYADWDGEGEVVPATDLTIGRTLADGAVTATADDVLDFTAALFDKSLTSGVSLKLMKQTGQAAGRPTGYGMGLLRYLRGPLGSPYGNTGIVNGYQSELRVVKGRETAWVVLANGSYGVPAEALAALADETLPTAIAEGR